MGATPRGRPRSAEAERRILEATLVELATNGFAKMTIGAVATRAGVAKTTIYRRWPSKLELVMAVVDRLRDAITFPDTGDIRADLTASMRSFTDALVDWPAGMALIRLTAEATTRPELAGPYRDRILGYRRQFRHLLQLGVERGQLRHDLDIEMGLDLFTSLVPYRMVVIGESVPHDLPERAVETVLAGAAR